MHARGIAVAELAAALGISADTIQRRIRRGELLAYRDHGRLRLAVNTGAGALVAGDATDRQAAGNVHALQARVQMLQAVLDETRGERDILRQQLVEHVHDRERWHTRLSEAHRLIAQRSQVQGETRAILERRPPQPRWWARLWWWWVRA